MKKHETVDLRRLDTASIGDATRDILYRTNGWDLADWRVAERRVYARSPEALERRRRFDIGGLASQSRQGGRGAVLPLQA